MSRTRTLGKWVLVVSAPALPASLIAVTSNAESASASSFHQYGYGVYAGFSGLAAGLSSTRYDIPVTISGSGSGCSVPFTGTPVYQTEWIIIYNQPNAWLELGTGHQCQGNEYWYAGYGYNGTWTPDWTMAISGSAQHSFSMYQSNSNGTLAWNWKIDSKTYFTALNGWGGVQLEVGVESYDGNAQTLFEDTSLEYNVHGWAPWPSMTTFKTSSQMCASEVDSTDIWVGEQC